MGIERRTCLGNMVLESAWLILLGEKHTHHEPLFFLIIRLKNNTLVLKKMAPPCVAACSLISPGLISNSFIFHYNNLQMILTCSLPLYLTLVLVFGILPFYFHKCLRFMVLTRTELHFGNLKQKQLLGSRRTCPPVC